MNFLENFINETIYLAYKRDMPGILVRPEHLKPLARYGMDRATLTQNGLLRDDVFHLYRSMYAHSTGFYEQIHEIGKKIARDADK